MQAIVADTTPLNYLVLIQAAEILPNLYRTVLIPPAVKAELAHANTPAIVRAWISQPPMVGSSEPEATRRFCSGTSRCRRAGSDIPCIRTPSHPPIDGRTRRCDYSPAAWIESGRNSTHKSYCTVAFIPTAVGAHSALNRLRQDSITVQPRTPTETVAWAPCLNIP